MLETIVEEAPAPAQLDPQISIAELAQEHNTLFLHGISPDTWVAGEFSFNGRTC